MTTKAEALEALCYSAAASMLMQCDSADIDLDEFTDGDADVRDKLLGLIYDKAIKALEEITVELNQNLLNRDIMCDAFMKKELG